MTTRDIQGVVSEAKAWSGYCMLYLGAGLLSLLWVVLEPGVYSVVPVFVFMGAALFQSHGIGKRLGELNDALERQGKRQ